MRLTEAKKRVYDAIAAFWKQHGYSPSYTEIADAVGLSSVATVHKHIVGLIDCGYLVRTNREGKMATVVPLPTTKGEWAACDERHRVVLYQGPMCPVCREKQATALTMQRVNGAKR